MVLTSEIEGKRRWEAQAESMQRHYNKTIDELRQELVEFKSRMVHDNARLKQDYQHRGFSVSDLAQVEAPNDGMAPREVVGNPFRDTFSGHGTINKAIHEARPSSGAKVLSSDQPLS